MSLHLAGRSSPAADARRVTSAELLAGACGEVAAAEFPERDLDPVLPARLSVPPAPPYDV